MPEGVGRCITFLQILFTRVIFRAINMTGGEPIAVYECGFPQDGFFTVDLVIHTKYVSFRITHLFAPGIEPGSHT